MTDETTITETRDGVRIEVELKRGTGTRDQDKITVTGHFEDLTEAQEHWGELHALAATEANAAREVQPDDEGDGD